MNSKNIIKCWLLVILSLCIYSVTFATTERWREIVDQLKDDWRPDWEIKVAIEDLWYNASEYLWKNIDSDIILIKDDEYTSRSCKTYKIEYIDSLDVYTSSDFKKKEYFVNIEYLKRYIDSKNPKQTNCSTNWWRISNPYNDTSNSSNRYIAPNWKIYFISNTSWWYTSYEMNNPKNFSSLSELKSYIRNRNPLVWMGSN